MLLTLGDDLSMSLWFDWLSLGAFVALDSAFTSTSTRKTFVDLCAKFSNLLEARYFRDRSIPVSISLYNWLAKRRLGLDCIGTFVLTNEIIKEWLASPSLSYTANIWNVRSIRIDNCVDVQPCLELTGRFEKLKSVELLHAQANEILLSIQICNQLTRLVLSEFRQFETDELCYFFGWQNDITDLSLTAHDGFPINELSNLRRSMASFRLHAGRIAAEDLVYVFPLCTSKLQRLELDIVSDSILLHLTQYCAKSLSSLSLRFRNSYCCSFENVTGLFRVAKQLSAVEILGYDIVSDDLLIALTDTNPQLTSQKLEYAPSVTVAGMTAVFQQCRLLEELRLGGVESEALGLLASHCPRLRVLEEANVSPLLLEDIMEGCPQLTSLHLVTDPQGGLWAKGWQLTTLSVNCRFVSLDAFICPSLTSLEVLLCSFTQEGFVMLLSQCRLRNVTLHAVPLQHTIGEILITTQTNTLVKLSVHHHMSPQVAAMLRKGLPRLRSLLLNGRPVVFE